MKVNIISVGSLTKQYNIIANEYRKMISGKLVEYEINYAKKIPANNIKQFEANLIEKKIHNGSKLVVLDERGKGITSQEFSKLIASAQVHSQVVDFIIGGAYGLDERLRSKADIILKLSDMTLPHQVVKLLLLEQIYRAETIASGHPYHK